MVLKELSGSNCQFMNPGMNVLELYFIDRYSVEPKLKRACRHVAREKIVYRVTVFPSDERGQSMR